MDIFDDLKDLAKSQGEKVLYEALEKEDNYVGGENDQVEKESYSRLSYNSVKKLRKKGVERGVKVPYLKYPVNREKKNVFFTIMAWLSLVILVAAFAGLVFLTIKLFIPMFSQTSNVSGDLLTRHEYDVFGFGMFFGGMSATLLWTLMILIVMVFVAIVLIFLVLTLKMFQLSSASTQELAHGREISSMITGLIVVLLLLAIFIVFCFVKIDFTKSGAILLVGALILLALFCGGLLALSIVQNKKAKKQFSLMPKEHQEDYLHHVKALNKAKKRISRDKKSFDKFGGTDF